MILGTADEVTPRGGRLLDAEAKEAQACLLDNGIAKLQGGFDDDDANAVWEDVTENNAPV